MNDGSLRYPLKTSASVGHNTGAHGHSCNCMDRSQKGIYFVFVPVSKASRATPSPLKSKTALFRFSSDASYIDFCLGFSVELNSGRSNAVYGSEIHVCFDTKCYCNKTKNNFLGFHSCFPVLDAILMSLPCSKTRIRAAQNENISLNYLTTVHSIKILSNLCIKERFNIVNSV